MPLIIDVAFAAMPLMARHAMICRVALALFRLMLPLMPPCHAVTTLRHDADSSAAAYAILLLMIAMICHATRATARYCFRVR